MTDLPPPNSQPPQRQPLGFDEFIGIFVAFTTIGLILFWGSTRQQAGFDLATLIGGSQPVLSPSPGAASPQAVPESTSITTPGVTTPNSSGVAPIPELTRPRGVSVIPFAVAPTPASPQQTTSALPETSGFSDVSRDFWAFPFIALLAQRKVIDGFPDGTYQPDRPVTRAEFATMLDKAFDKNAAQNAVKFRDLPAGYWASSAINEAIATGFMKGYPNNIFLPNQQIPKVQVLVALVNGLGLTAQSAPANQLQKYEDAGQIPQYGVDKVAAASDAGLVVNYPERSLLQPNKVATRAEVAALIYQGLVREGKANQVSSQYLVQPQ